MFCSKNLDLRHFCREKHNIRVLRIKFWENLLVRTAASCASLSKSLICKINFLFQKIYFLFQKIYSHIFWTSCWQRVFFSGSIKDKYAFRKIRSLQCKLWILSVQFAPIEAWINGLMHQWELATKLDPYFIFVIFCTQKYLKVPRIT